MCVALWPIGLNNFEAFVNAVRCISTAQLHADNKNWNANDLSVCECTW